MKKALLVIITMCIVYYCLQYSAFNTGKVKACGGGSCGSYNIHNSHEDRTDAGHLMHEIVTRNEALLEHLKQKYSIECNVDNKCRSINETSTQDLISERVNQLFEQYDDTKIYEISPQNSSGSTSYTENKKTLVLCLRQKQSFKLHDPNDMMFVVIHELTHMMNNKWGHPEEFWKLFKVMLRESVEAGIYVPVDYSVDPINYCGLDLAYNPLFDKNV